MSSSHSFAVRGPANSAASAASVELGFCGALKQSVQGDSSARMFGNNSRILRNNDETI